MSREYATIKTTAEFRTSQRDSGEAPESITRITDAFQGGLLRLNSIALAAGMTPDWSTLDLSTEAADRISFVETPPTWIVMEVTAS